MLEANVTVAPLTMALVESFAITVIVAAADPSAGIVAALLETVRLVTVLVVPVPGPVPVLVQVEPELPPPLQHHR